MQDDNHELLWTSPLRLLQVLLSCPVLVHHMLSGVVVRPTSCHLPTLCHTRVQLAGIVHEPALCSQEKQRSPKNN